MTIIHMDRTIRRLDVAVYEAAGVEMTHSGHYLAAYALHLLPLLASDVLVREHQLQTALALQQHYTVREAAVPGDKK